MVAGYFFAGPILLAIAQVRGEPLLHYRGFDDARAIFIYGLAAPFVGMLIALRASRARFAAYVFITMEIVRSTMAADVLPLTISLVLLAYLQLPHMRRRYPPIDPKQIRERLRRRLR